MTKTKSTFILYSDYLEKFAGLSEAQLGQLFKSILVYQNGGEVKIDDPVTKLAWAVVKIDMDKEAKKWAETKDARSEAARKAINARWERQKEIKSIREHTDVYERIQPIRAYTNVSKHTNSESVSVSNIKNKKKKINKKEKVAKKSKSKFSSLSSLREFEFEVTRELACKQQTTPEFVKSKLEDLENYCQRSGRVYKDYKAALAHFVKSDPHKPTYVPREKRVNRAEEILAKYRLAEWQERQGEERVR